jgi:RNA polymerase sigma-70 factor (sigma-E family)
VIGRHHQREFEDFVRASGGRLVRTAFLLCGDRGEAEDVVQTALERTARRWSAARRDPAAYARRVVVNLVKDGWRRTARRPAELPLDVDVAVPVVDGLADRDELVRALGTLPEGQRSVLVLRFFEDLSVAETATALRCTQGTVKSQTSRGLDRLRAALTPEKETSRADR